MPCGSAGRRSGRRRSPRRWPPRRRRSRPVGTSMTSSVERDPASRPLVERAGPAGTERQAALAALDLDAPLEIAVGAVDPGRGARRRARRRTSPERTRTASRPLGPISCSMPCRRSRVIGRSLPSARIAAAASSALISWRARRLEDRLAAGVGRGVRRRRRRSEPSRRGRPRRPGGRSRGPGRAPRRGSGPSGS